MESIVDKMKPLQDLTIMKDLVIKFFSELSFDKEKHIYNTGEIQLKSVSNVIKKYHKNINFKQVAFFVAKSRGVTVEEVLTEWEETKNNACKQGTLVHTFSELYTSNFDKVIANNGYEQAVINFWDLLPTNLVPFLFELQMYSKSLGIGGTADIILYNTNTGKFVIADYKGLPLDTPILTDKGWVNMGDLTIKHKVFDKDGKICNIKNISNIHNKKCLKIKFDNNEEIISDFEHRWLIHKGSNKKGNVMTSQEIKDYLDSFSKPISSFQTLRILNNASIDIKNITLPIDPYVFGVWLGDGHKVDGKITQMNKKVWKEIEHRGYILGPDLSQGNSGLAQTRTVYGLEKELRKLNLLKNKHLPSIFILSSKEQKIDILRGLMDSDGYYNKHRKRFVLSTTKKNQVEFCTELLASLGIKSTIIPCNKYCKEKIIKGFDVCFSTDLFNPFLCRNENIKVITNNQNKYRRIISVEEVKQVPTKCIEVDSLSHTFLCTKRLIPTHNTNKDIYKNYNKTKLLTPFNNLLDNPLNKYKIQLSLYQILFEQCGFQVENRFLIWLKEDGSFEQIDLEDLTNELKTDLKNE